MIIESKRIILRSWKEDDINDLVEGLNNIEVSKWMAGVPYPFDVLGLRRIDNGYFKDNEKSRKMQLKLGYKDEGIRRKAFLCMATGEYMDECITGLLKEEFIEWSDKIE